MGYMAGDYYAGDYYAGGLLSGLGSLAKGVFRVAKGFATGGLPGALGGAIGHAVIETHSAPGGPGNLPPARTAPIIATHDPAISGFLRRGGRFSAAGKAKLVREHNAALQPKLEAPGMGPHLFGRRRRMNWANPRALGRAERRIHAAVKHMTKYIRWVHPTKVGHAVPKFKKRSR